MQELALAIDFEDARGTGLGEEGHTVVEPLEGVHLDRTVSCAAVALGRVVAPYGLAGPRIDLDQEWLDGYGLEPYILFSMIKHGYRHAEVPCTKLYPPREIGNTKMRPISGWIDILKPVVLLGLGLKR